MELRARVGNVEISFVRLPLVVVRFVGASSDPEFREYLRIMERNLDECEAQNALSAVLIDTRGQVGAVSASQRRIQAEWIREHYRRLARHCAGMAFVIDSALHRGIVTAVFWLQDLPYPHVVVPNVMEGEAWCARQLATMRSLRPSRGDQRGA